MCFIQYVCRVPLRMTDAELEEGDYAIHGEEPYTFDYYNRDYRSLPVGYDHQGQVLDVNKAGDGSSGSGTGNGRDLIIGQDPERGDVVTAIGKEGRKQE